MHQIVFRFYYSYDKKQKLFYKICSQKLFNKKTHFGQKLIRQDRKQL
jgi:hypothetical protein